MARADMKLILLSLATLILLSLPSLTLAAPKADLWEYWKRHDSNSSINLDHSAWTRLLKTYVSQGPEGINRFDYQGVTDEDLSRLDSYIQTLTDTQVRSLSRASQKSYWINLYNALTVQVVPEHYPVQSIKDIDISPGLFASGPLRRQLRLSGLSRPPERSLHLTEYRGASGQGSQGVHQSPPGRGLQR